jgi:thiamine monophosphate synthase
VLLSARGADAPEAARIVSSEGLAGIVLAGAPGPGVVARTRDALGASGYLGRSVHGSPGAAVHEDTLTFSVFAPVFVPRTEPGTKVPAGLAELAAWCRAGRGPVLALGGIDGARAAACLAVGAAGLAGIAAFFGPLESVAQDVAGFAAASASHPHAC